MAKVIYYQPTDRPTFYVTSYWGQIRPSIGPTPHIGVDVTGFSEIMCVSEGERVIQVGYNSIEGNFVRTLDKAGLRWSYKHMLDNSIGVSVGQVLTLKSVIGIMGTTGSSTGVHLHFDCWDGTKYINPMELIGLENSVGLKQSKLPRKGKNIMRIYQKKMNGGPDPKLIGSGEQMLQWSDSHGDVLWQSRMARETTPETVGEVFWEMLKEMKDGEILG